MTAVELVDDRRGTSFQFNIGHSSAAFDIGKHVALEIDKLSETNLRAR
jgi:hypothetical protein